VAESRDYSEPLYEIEALVRQAGNYVRASDDLRPRVLETARAERRERRAQSWLWQAAFSVVLLGMLAAAMGQRREVTAARQPGAALEASQVCAREEAAAATGRDVTWELVDAFTKLRQRHAALLRLAL
jgi:hypothetical protein